MKTLIIVAHPRTNSLTWKITEEITRGLEEQKTQYEILDLYREEFNPVLYLHDEPDYSNPHKVYSPKVTFEMERIRKFDSIMFVFPVWWFNVPAILKGYIDRVFNYGFS